MADVVRAVDIIFGAIDKTASGFNSVSGNLEDFAGGIEDATKPLADAFDKVVKLELAIVGLAGVMGGLAIAAASDYETAQAELAKVLSDSDLAFEEFQPDVERLGSTYGLTNTEVLNSVAIFKQAGFALDANKEALGLTESALKAVRVAELEAGTATEFLIATIKGFRFEASQSEEIIGKVNLVTNEYATNSRELLTAISQLSPIAQLAGLSFDEMTALVTPAIEIFRSGSEVANAFKTGLLRITDERDAVSGALASIGISQRDTNDQLKTGGELIFELIDKWGGLDNALQTVIAREVFGIRQTAKLSAALSSQQTVLEIQKLLMTEAADGTALWATTLENELTRRLDTTEVQLEKFTSALVNTAATAGGPVLESFGKLVEAATGLADAIKRAIEQGQFDTLFDAINASFTSAAETLTEIAANLGGALEGVDFKPIVDGFQNVANAISELFGVNQDVSGIDALKGSLQGFVNLLGGFQNTVAGSIEGIDGLVKIVLKLGEAYANADDDTQSFVGEVIGLGKEINVFAGFAEGAFGAVNALSSAFIALKLGSFISEAGAAATVTDLLKGGALRLGTALGTAGLVGSLLAVGVALGALVEEFTGFGSFLNDNLYDPIISLFGGDSANSLGTWIYELINGTDDFVTATTNLNTEADKTTRTLRALGETEESLARSVKLLNEDLVKSGAEFRLTNDLTRVTVEQYEAMQYVTNELGRENVELSEAVKLYREAQEKANAEQKKALENDPAEQAIRAKEAFAGMNAILEESGEQYRFLADGTKVSVEKFNELQGTLEVIREETKGAGISAEQAARATELYGDAWTVVDGVVQRTLPAVNEEIQGTLDKSTGIKKVIGEDGVVAFERFGAEAPKQVKKVKDELTEGEKAARELEIKMEEIASNERIKALELKIGLDIAELEAETEKAVAIIQTLESTVADTTGSIVDLFGILTNADRYEQTEIQSQIRKQNERLDAQLKLQEKLINAQIDSIRARTEALRSGSALITVRGDGLEPQLEAFMFELLKNIQIEASQEGANFLLGLDT